VRYGVNWSLKWPVRMESPRESVVYLIPADSSRLGLGTRIVPGAKSDGKVPVCLANEKTLEWLACAVKPAVI
jgi:hypothetical protein